MSLHPPIFAWTGALHKRGELDGNTELMKFAEKLEDAVIKTIESGEMTKDLMSLSTAPSKKQLDTIPFMEAVQKRLNS